MYWQKRLVSLFTAMFIVCMAHAQMATGLIFDDDAYEKEQRMSPSLKFADTYRSSYSLRKYCPIAGNQGYMSSCVGWAIGYAAHTISLAVRDSITDKTVITQMAKSALYIYNQVKVGDCDDGSRITAAMSLLKNRGVCGFSEFNPTSCGILPADMHHRLASAGKIGEYFTLFQVNATRDQKIIATINSLNANKPVVVGMMLTPSFERIGSTGMWSPLATESYTGGHAMCVVGYDTINRRFEILNSWGPSFGDNGFVYVSFDDYARHCRYGFQMMLKTTSDSSPVLAAALQGGFYLNRLTGFDNNGGYMFEKLTGHWNGRYYEIAPGNILIGDYFKIMAVDLQANSYLYIFSIKPNGHSELLFPTTNSGSWGAVRDAPVIISKNNYVEIPADPSRAIVADIAGVDHLVCLFSKQRLDNIDELMWQVEQRSGDVYDRLKSVLGRRMLPASDISYMNNQIYFSSRTHATGDVVPVVLKVSVN